MNKRLLRVFISHSLPLLFTSILLGGGAMAITYNFAGRNSEQEAHNQLEQIQAYYELILTEMDSLNLMFSTSSEIIAPLSYMLELDHWSLTDYYDLRMIRSYISTPVNARPYIDSIYVYLDNNHNRFLSSETGITPLNTMADTGWFDSFALDGGASEFRAEYVVLNEPRQENAAKQILRIFRTIYNTKPRPIGVIVLNLRADRLAKDYPAAFFGEGSFFIISDTRGNRLLSVPSDPDLSLRTLQKEFVSFSLVSRRFGWNYELNIPRDYLYRVPRTIGIMTIALSLFVCIIGLLLTYKTNQKEILRAFLEQDYLRIQKEVMEYRALQMQINPHFLFNTLETINWSAVALLNGPNDVSRMIQILSRLLKYSMQISANSGVPLEEEIEHTRDYLKLQNIRFAGKFSARWHIDPGAGAVQVPRLIFQPILENSFTHGFWEDGQPLKIRIDIRRAANGGSPGERLIISIKDNGEGIDKETLARINADEPAEGDTSIGLVNIRKRIFLFYKGRAEITILSEGKNGTEIKISAPAQQN
jgi:two-component system sensor histidine kinase YesM